MVHAGNGEVAEEVADLHVRVGARELVHGLVVARRVAGAVQLVGPAYVLEQLPVVRRACEGGEVWVDGLSYKSRSTV